MRSLAGMADSIDSGVIDLAVSDMACTTSSAADREGSLESARSSSMSSLNSAETPSEDSRDRDETSRLTHKLSLINILEMSTSSIKSPDSEMTASILSCPDVDLEIEQEDLMAQALSSISKHDRGNRAGKIEKAIKNVSFQSCNVSVLVKAICLGNAVENVIDSFGKLRLSSFRSMIAKCPSPLHPIIQIQPHVPLSVKIPMTYHINDHSENI